MILLNSQAARTIDNAVYRIPSAVPVSSPHSTRPFVWCKLLLDYVLYLVFEPVRGNKKSLRDQRKACEKILSLAKKNNVIDDHMKDDDELVLDETEKGNRSTGSILYRVNLLISSQDSYTIWSRLLDVWLTGGSNMEQTIFLSSKSRQRGRIYEFSVVVDGSFRKWITILR
ncbi:hypothetical protein HAX54_028027 [Datura stramonium]|uniref:Uncharacterized protein n=1 Tax=Datura stramonium TaxID=4076 RepID=A0ABS8V3I7_DATST|nr:hypothetical protein [Datura stramonium]